MVFLFFYSLFYIYTDCHMIKSALIVVFLVITTYCCKDKHCVFCPNSPKQCQKCEDNYRLTVDFRCQKCYDKNCLQCPQYYGRCKICKDGYRLAATTCFKCFDDNCRKCNKNHMECQECLAGYELRGNSCLKVNKQGSDQL